MRQVSAMRQPRVSAVSLAMTGSLLFAGLVCIALTGGRPAGLGGVTRLLSMHTQRAERVLSEAVTEDTQALVDSIRNAENQVMFENGSLRSPQPGAVGAAAEQLAKEGEYVAETVATAGEHAGEPEEGEHVGAGEVERHGEEGEAERGEEGGHEGDTKTSIVLFVMSAFFMLIIYLVNWHDADIRHFAWNIIMASISIFIAVLSYGVLSKILSKLVFEPLGHPITHHTGADCRSIIFLMIWIIVEAEMYLTMSSPPALKAVGIIGAHISGFAGLRAFSALQVDTFSSSWATSLVPVFLAFVLMTILAFVGGCFRDRVNKGDGQVDKEEEEWEEQCIETENDFIGMTTSFVFVNSVVFMLTGVLPELEQEFYETHSVEQMTWLFACCLGCGLAVIGSTLLRKRARASFPASRFPKINRIISTLQVFWSMAGAWCFFMWGAWYCSSLISRHGPHSDHTTHPSVLLGKLFQSVVVSLLGTAIVFVFDYCADSSPESARLMRANVTGIGIAIGFSWEKAFDRALENLVEKKFVGGSEFYTHIFICISLICLLYPGWRLYILPKTSKHLDKEVGKNPHPFSICCPDRYADAYEESSEGECSGSGSDTKG
eukprot:TRINITY_DN29556_c0_g1_i1.p1 TRINITY_DN29556_c0_g1~~TRINITY_DN29556_c0_g1_i1.p1  ORF type:complete len:604 (+),score=91.60 TRINITY_DN29556_c0_g1_i1:146-1957(+)